MLRHKEYIRYIFVAFFLFVIYLAYLVVKPFLAAIISSALLAYIFYPLYDSLKSKLKSSSASAFITSILIILLITIPFLFLLSSVTKESQFVYIKAKQIFITGDVFSLGCSEDDSGMACRVSSWISGVISKPNVRYHLETSIEGATTSFSKRISEFVFSIPNIALGIFVTFFTMFYLFKDGKEVIERVKRVMPLSLNDQKKVFQKINEATYAIVYGSLLVAAVQGIVGGVGYLFFGISSPILWGIFTAIFALLPFIGTAFVWIPLSLLLIVQGFPLQGIGLLLYGTFIVASMDNVLRPFVVGRKAKIHPVLVLLGALGGLAVFGFIGFVVGPLILALFMTFLEIYENERVNGAIKG